MLGDLVMSIGVIISSVIIYFHPTWTIADPLCTYLFSIIVCVTTLPTIKVCMTVLIESAPMYIDPDQVKSQMQKIEGVDEVHEFHLWSISVGKLALSAHMTSKAPQQALQKVTEMLKKDYDFEHITIQVEESSEEIDCVRCS